MPFSFVQMHPLCPCHRLLLCKVWTILPHVPLKVSPSCLPPIATSSVICSSICFLTQLYAFPSGFFFLLLCLLYHLLLLFLIPNQQSFISNVMLLYCFVLRVLVASFCKTQLISQYLSDYYVGYCRANENAQSFANPVELFPRSFY